MNYTKKVLQRFGLTENEVTVYLETLKHTETSPYAIAQSTKIARTTVYDVLMSLSLKGLVTLQQSDGFSKQQTKIRAKNPSELRALLHRKQKDLAALDVEIVDILPQLKQDYHKQEANADFAFYPGIEGAKKVYFMPYLADMSLPAIAFENCMPMDVFGKEAINDDVNTDTRIHKRTATHIRELMALNDWTKHVLTYQYGRDKNYLTTRQSRYLHNPSFALNQRIVVQGSRIAITCVKDEENWGLLMHSASLADTLRSIFEVLWQTAIPITAEFLDSLGSNKFLEAERLKQSQ